MSTVIKRGSPRKTNRMGEQTIEKIVSAARETLVADGLGKFSIDRVARKAEVTKGTLLYHFSTKEALLKQLADGYVAHLERHLQRGIQNAKESPAYRKDVDVVAAGFIEWFREFRLTSPDYTTFGLSMLAVAAEQPAIRASIQGWYESVFERMKANATAASLPVVLAMEGLFFLGHFHLRPIGEEETDRLLSFFVESLNRTAAEKSA